MRAQTHTWQAKGLRWTEKDKGLAELRRKLKAMRAGHPMVRVGVWGKGSAAGPVDMVRLALIHEFGAPAAGIPERSFLRAPVQAGRAEYAALMRRLLPAVYEGRRPMRQVLEVVGQRMVADVQAWVRAGTNLAPLAPATVRRRRMGSDIPLLDTGRLLSAVTYEVRMPAGLGK